MIATAQLLLRPLTEADVEQVLAIEHECFAKFPLPEWEFTSHIYVAGHFGLVAELDGQVAGFMLYEKRSDVYIADIAVSNSHRRLGVAEAMLNWLKERLDFLSRTSISLHVKVDNKQAQALYVKVGFAYASPDIIAGGYPDGAALRMVFNPNGKLPAATKNFAF